MTMSMGILGKSLTLDEQRREISTGPGAWLDDQDELSVYLVTDHVLSESENLLLIAHDSGHPIMRWSDDGLLEQNVDELAFRSIDIEKIELSNIPAAARFFICFFIRIDE